MSKKYTRLAIRSLSQFTSMTVYSTD